MRCGWTRRRGEEMELCGLFFEIAAQDVFAVRGGDDEGLVEDVDLEILAVEGVAGGDAGVGEGALVSGESDAVVALESDGPGVEVGLGHGDLEHGDWMLPG